MRKTTLVSMILLAFTLPLFAQLDIEEEAPIIPSGRIAAIGGPHVALADDLSTLFLNPAGFQAAGPQMSLAEATLGLAGPVFSIADLVMQIMNGADINALLNAEEYENLLNSLYAAAALNGPIAFGYVGNGFGFGIFNTSDLRFLTVGTIPTVTAFIAESVTLQGGYAFRIPIPEDAKMTLDLGFMLKSFIRAELGISDSIISLLGLLVTPSVDILLAQELGLVVGAGLDVGIRYSLADIVTLGIVGRNLPTFTMRSSISSPGSILSGGAVFTSAYGYVPIDLSAGIMLSPGLGFFDRFISKLKIFLDYSDILDFLTHPDTSRNPFLHIGTGAELTLLEVLALRGGFYDGYFSAGFGLDLTFVRIDLSMFGRELSAEPGMRPVYNVMLGILFRI